MAPQPLEPRHGRRIVGRNRLVVAHRDRQTDREVAGAGPEHLDGASVGGDEVVAGGQPALAVATARREHAAHVAHEAHDVRLVDRAGACDEIADVPGRLLAEAAEAIDDRWVGPATVDGRPPWGREVMEGHRRFETVLEAGRADPPVVVEGGGGELALLRLDAAPLDREPVGVEPERGQQGEVGRIAVVLVAGVAAGLDAPRARRLLPRPPVVVDVATLDLVGGGGGSPTEPGWKGSRHGGHASARGRGPAADLRRGLGARRKAGGNWVLDGLLPAV